MTFLKDCRDLMSIRTLNLVDIMSIRTEGMGTRVSWLDIRLGIGLGLGVLLG